MFACGAANFAQMDNEDPAPTSPPPTPKTAAAAKKKVNKNPYAARGLDKFSMVVAELETKREKIIARTGAQGVAMIRFMNDNTTSQGWVPIIVRPKDPKPTTTELAVVEKQQSPATSNEKQEEDGVEEKRVVGGHGTSISKSSNKGLLLGGGWRMRLRWKESYYWPLVMVLILLCLVMFGRVFAICCTSVWWYMAPNMNRDRFVLGKKVIEGRLSDKKLRSPRAAANGIGKKG